MDPAYSQILQLGAIGAFAAILLWHSIRRERDMAARLDADKDKMFQVVENNTAATLNLVSALKQRPCLLAEKIDLDKVPR